MRPKRDLTEGKILPHLLKMAIPMMLGLTGHMLLNIADGIFVSRLGQQQTLAVLNYGFPFYYLLFAFFNGLSTGTASVLSRFIGAKKKSEAENTLGQIIQLALGTYLVFLLAYPFALPIYLDIQQALPESQTDTWQYLNMMLIGLPFSVISLLWGAGLRAEGNMRTLMNGLLLGTLSNLILDPFLIFSSFNFLGITWQGMGLGVQGAGAATSIANILTAAYIGSYFFKQKAALTWKIRVNWKTFWGLKQVFSVGFPSILSQSLIGVNLGIMTWLARPFGEAATAAIGIGARLDTLAIFPGLSIMTAIVSTVGQNYGANKHERVKEAMQKGLILSFFALSFVGLLVFLFREPLILLFSPEPETLSSASHFVKFLCMGYGFVGLSMAASGTFQGLGRGMPFLFITILRMILLNLPLAYILSRHTHFGEYGLHYAPFLGSMTAGLIATSWIVYTVVKLGPDSKNKSEITPETQPA